ncbi:MAG: Gfo/Idh/MocA family protein [Planctomycetales bacterium]
MLRLAVVGVRTFALGLRCACPRLRHIQVTAAVERDLVESPRAAEAWGVTLVADSLERLVAEHADSFDAIVQECSERHPVEECLLAAQVGKPILLLPGAGNTFRGAEHVLRELSQAAQACVMVGEPLRFTPAARIMREAIAEGKIGAPGLLRIHRWRAARDPEPGDAAGEIDLACWLFGDQPRTVFTLRDERGRAEDYWQLHLGFHGGGMALIDGGTMLPAHEHYASYSLIGARGAVYADDHHNRQLLFGQEGVQGISTGDTGTKMALLLEEFAAAIQVGRESDGTVAERLRTLRVLDAMRDSLAKRAAVVLEGSA